MAKKLIHIEPSVLRWARETQGYSVEDVAIFIKQDPDDVLEWELGKSFPTYAQLEKLAYGLFKRPLAIFFLPEPPKEMSPKKAFRTLPETDLEELAADTRYQVRFALALQISLKELHDDVNPAPKKIFRDMQLTTSSSLRESQVDNVREYLGVSRDTQASWISDDQALKAWRSAVEDAGVYVFKHAFKQKSISGFCLLDAEFPIIYLNNSASKTRQIFSLFHELGHLLLNVNGISKFDSTYIIHLPQHERSIEIYCNQFAAELLIPERDFSKQLCSVQHIDDNTVKDLAQRYSVSREAVFRRMLDKGLISQAEYEAKSKQWAAQKVKSQGGDYYHTQTSYFGERYLQLVFGKHYQGKLSIEQVADYLGVKVSTLRGLEDLMLRKEVVS